MHLPGIGQQPIPKAHKRGSLALREARQMGASDGRDIFPACPLPLKFVDPLNQSPL